jgi:hypothetical protein
MRGAILSLFIAGLAVFVIGNAVVQPSTYGNTLSAIRNTSNSLVAVPFGGIGGVKFSDSSLVATALDSFDPNNIASDEAWNKYKAKGAWYGCLLDMSDIIAGEQLGDQRTTPSAESIWRGDLQSKSSDVESFAACH